jgi:EAL domain-containing protein (putative c-di-GMP-specific phosphodiesterase class I)
VFVSTLSTATAATGIIRAVIDLAHALGLPAIAEGVETQDEWRQLAALGCDGVQGWFIAMPMPGEQATEWIRGHRDTATLALPAGATPATEPVPASLLASRPRAI